MLEPMTLHELENFLGALAGVAEPSEIIIEEIPLEKVKHCNHCNNCKTATKQQTEALSPVKNVIFDAPYTTVISMQVLPHVLPRSILEHHFLSRNFQGGAKTQRKI